MSKNFFKKEIQQRYNGRGNSWVKVLMNQEGSEKIFNLLNNLPEDLKCDYIEHTNREGFFWIRFSKVEGTAQDPQVKFEVRYKGSKEDQPESTVTFSDSIASKFKLLGNTPVKLQLEIQPHNRKKVKKSFSLKKRSFNKKSEEVDNFDVDVEKEISIIKEASLTKPSDRELELWYEFLKLNNLYEENV